MLFLSILLNNLVLTRLQVHNTLGLQAPGQIFEIFSVCHKGSPPPPPLLTPFHSYYSAASNWLGVDLKMRSLCPHLRQEIRGLKSVYKANMAGYQSTHMMSSASSSSYKYRLLKGLISLLPFIERCF
jgi:hypothetical protein